MRWLHGAFLAGLLLWLSGCASSPAAPLKCTVPPPPEEPDAQLASSALVFDHPISSGRAMPDLSRAPREPGAFVAFDQTITTVYSLRFDDRQLLDRRGLMDRRATTVRFGVSTR